MAKTFVIGNRIYLPISDSLNKTKYISGDMNGNIFMNEIFTEEEILENHSDSSFTLHTCKGLVGIVETWKRTP